MLIDTHSHLNFNAYKNDADEVIRRSLDNNVWVINVGSQYETSKKAVEIAQNYPEGVYAAIGLHPIHLSSGIFKTKIDEEEIEFQTKEEEFDYEKYKNLAFGKNLEGSAHSKNLAFGKNLEGSAHSKNLVFGKNLEGSAHSKNLAFGKNLEGSAYSKELAHSANSGQAKSKIVAIGEIGFDYWYRPKTKVKLTEFKNRQKEVFLKQIELAKELNLPMIFHCRVAHEDIIQILQQSNTPNIRGVMHCFTGTLEDAKKYIEMGFYLGFNGLIFKMDWWDNIIKEIPLEKILIETDCPYLTPAPMMGRNEPIYVKYVAEKIAKLKNLSYEEITKATTENARKLFQI